MKLEKSQGLLVSEKVLKFVKRELNSFKSNGSNVYIGTFTNLRECGLTYMCYDKGRTFTFCTYEHRNSDGIIINGKEGLVCANGELPYGGNKWDCLASFNCGEYEQAGMKLAELIKEFLNAEETNA